jgi:prepilin-type N-terminal cleavage/methylation domain-containing protein
VRLRAKRLRKGSGRERIFVVGETAGDAGFTLVELSIVIAIIMLLLGILVPVLNRCRRLAQQAACQNRLRQWGWAFKMYAADNEGCYPHTDGRDRCGGEEPISEPGRIDYYFGWVDVVAPLMGQKPWREHQKWHYPGPETIFQCPAARLIEGNLYDYNPERNGYFSYAMNSCLELDINCRWWESEGCSSPMPSFLHTESIKTPERVILLFEQLLDPRLGYDGKILNRKAGKYCGAYPREFCARHAKGGGVLGGFILYCDYHVGWASTVWKEDWPADLYVPPRDDADWFPY